MSAADYKAQVKVLADVLDSCPLTEPCDLMWRPTGWCKKHCKDGQDSPDAECWMRYARVMTENKTESDKMVDQFREDTKKTEDVPDNNVGKIPYKKPEIIRCKDCQYRDPEDKKCDHGHGIVWQLPRPDDWFCADGKA